MQAQYRQELLSLQVCIIAPQTSYEITQANLYDYDLPPGLVTLRVAHTVMQLYRRGGRLTPKSVHKLLRLGEFVVYICGGDCFLPVYSVEFYSIHADGVLRSNVRSLSCLNHLIRPTKRIYIYIYICQSIPSL